MKPETEQTLATLEVILDKSLWFSLPYHDGESLKPYVWNSEQQGVFSSLSLIRSEGWIQEIDIEEAVKNWQWSEQTGLAAQGILNDDPYCIKDDEAEILLDENTKITREKKYQRIFKLLLNKVSNLQAFKFNCNLDYSLSVIIGQVSNQQWIALSPTVPQETPSYFNQEVIRTIYSGNQIICSSYTEEKEHFKLTDNLSLEIKKQIDELSSIKVYGWYDGGYNNVREYKIVLATGENKEVALQNILLESKLLEIYKFESFEIFDQLESYAGDEAEEVKAKYNLLHNFLHNNFSELLVYRFCFWDYEHLYILGEKGDRDRVGIALHSQFTYNP